jgi:hypothetical protein
MEYLVPVAVVAPEVVKQVCTQLQDMVAGATALPAMKAPEIGAVAAAEAAMALGREDL